MSRGLSQKKKLIRVAKEQAVALENTLQAHMHALKQASTEHAEIPASEQAKLSKVITNSHKQLSSSPRTTKSRNSLMQTSSKTSAMKSCRPLNPGLRISQTAQHPSMLNLLEQPGTLLASWIHTWRRRGASAI